MISRRALLMASTSALALPLITRAESPGQLASALASSSLVYITPLKSNGEESSCQSEVWFAYDGESVFVVTSAEAWRARAPERGLRQARLWVGEFGNWKRSDGKYRSAPSLQAEATVDNDPDAHEKALTLFGKKYNAEWGTWGPRFRNGLAEGSRVLLRYTT